MIFTQRAQDRLYISHDPVWMRALMVSAFGICFVAFMSQLPNLNYTHLLAMVVFSFGFAALVQESLYIELDFHRANNTLTISRTLFRWSTHRTISLTDIKGVRIRDEEGGVALSLIFQDANADKRALDLLGTATSHRKAKDLAQIITEWLETPSPA